MGAENLEALLNSWQHSPRVGRFRTDDGVEPAQDFLGEFSIDLLLAPSPPPQQPPAPAPQPLEESSGTAGSAPTSAPHSAPSQLDQPDPSATQQQPANGQQNGMSVPPSSLTQQHFAAGQQHGHLQPNHHLSHHPLSYMLPITAASSGTLPALDTNGHLLAQHAAPAPMMPLAAAGSAPQSYLATHTNGLPHPLEDGPLVLAGLSPVPTATSSQQPSGGTQPNDKRRRGPRPRVFKKHTCQSDGCTVDLAPLSFYLQRNHICPDHLKADSYLVKGVPSRFCQRCGQGHPLTEFEGSKRSCRKALERHNQRRRDKQVVSAATGPSAAPEQMGAPNHDPADLAQHTDAMMGAWLDDTLAAMQGQALPHPQQLQQLPQSQSTLHFTQSLQPQQALQQAPQQASPHVPAPALGGSLYQQQQQQEAQLQQQIQQLQQQPWLTVPRHLVEQHAPQLLTAALPAASAPPVWQLQQHLRQHEAQQMPRQAPQQAQQQVAQQQQQQPPQQAQHQQVHVQQQAAVPLQSPRPRFVSVIEEPSFTLWHGEFGGSGI